MRMLIRSMSPKIIAADEIGNMDEIEPINYAICSGVKCIFTAHGSCLEDIYLNPMINKLLKGNLFERIIFLNDKFKKAAIDKVYFLNKEILEYTSMEW